MTGKNLTTIYITHGHADHFFGLNTIPRRVRPSPSPRQPSFQKHRAAQQIEELNPRIVVAGHKRPDARDDDPATILGGTKAYIRDFDRSLSGSHSAQELIDKMMVLQAILATRTRCGQQRGVFEQGQGASS